MEKAVCGNCWFCVKEEGEPYYCANRDLYHFVTDDAAACVDWRVDNNARSNKLSEMVD